MPAVVRPPPHTWHRWRWAGRAVVGMLLALVAGCAGLNRSAPTLTPAQAAAAPCPGERELVEGSMAYEEGRYARAEAMLLQALDKGLAGPADRAHAYKLIAFIACASDRAERCEAAFIAARSADPTFRLARSEAGHPVWGPVYQRVAQR